jgi:putative oxygen-independent coproporphyrinogen III oxidase
VFYIHVPFCRSFCNYCGFYSETCNRASQSQAFDEYAEALEAEIEERTEEIAEHSRTSNLNTIYIGGGTPSVLPLDVLGRIVRPVTQLCQGSPLKEFTIEVNPEDIVEKGPHYVSGLLDLGVSRISMGIQSFDDGILKWMNRRHSSSGARQAFRTIRKAAQEAGKDIDLSIDLMFGLPMLDEEAWKNTVSQAIALGSEDGFKGPEHISAYQLSIEEGSTLENMIAEGRCREASEEVCRNQYDILCSMLSEAGFHHYEVSNFALPGHEAIHNSAYWKRIPYIGLGPGAHSLSCLKDSSGGLVERRSWNSQELPRRRRNGSLATYSREEEVLSPEDIRIERIMLALRTDKGMDESALRSLAGEEAVGLMLAEGALVRNEGRLHIPEDKFFISDEIIRELV